MLRERHSAHVHAKQAGHQVHGQRQHGHQGQHEDRPTGLFIDARRQLFLQQFYPFGQRRGVGHRRRELLGRLAQIEQVGLADPGDRAAQQPKQGRRFRRQQALQSHQRATQQAQFAATYHDAACQQRVFDDVDPRGRLPHDVYQHLRLVAHQVRQQVGGRAQGLAGAHFRAQAIDRAQRPQARAHHQARRDAQRGRRDARGIKSRIEQQIVDHRDERVARLLEPRGADGLFHGFIEGFGQRQGLAHPPLRAGVREREMQPQEGFRPRRGRLRQPSGGAL